VVPTFQEVESLPHLLDRIAALRQDSAAPIDVLIMDDNSRDGTVAMIAERALPWVELVTRTTDRGLSLAVLDGLRRATGDVLVVMDADLSHPPETIPDMVRTLERADFALGSRYVAGGTTAEGWGLFRRVNSWVATALARPFTRVADPMSGFFALKRETFERAEACDPIGYKIGLELIVKCKCRQVVELPIHFANREEGASKLTIHEQLRYLQHIYRLALYKIAPRSRIGRVALAAALGGILFLACLFGLRQTALPLWSSLASAALVGTGAAALLVVAFQRTSGTSSCTRPAGQQS
jgi:dolichol-phosphate mannosyltransferase